MLIQVRPVRDLVREMDLSSDERDAIVRVANDALIEMRRVTREHALLDAADMIHVRIRQEQNLPALWTGN